MHYVSRGHGYTIAKIDCLLEIIEDNFLIGPNDWDRHGRTHETLKRKFASLHNHKKPTGDPTCPPHVRNAKRIWDLIKIEMDVSDGEGRGDIEADVNTGGNDVPDGIPAPPHG